MGLDESLIANGLHSLSAANLAWLVEEEFEVRIKLSEILDTPTLRGLLRPNRTPEIWARRRRPATNEHPRPRAPIFFRFHLLKNKSGFWKDSTLASTATDFSRCCIVTVRSMSTLSKPL